MKHVLSARLLRTSNTARSRRGQFTSAGTGGDYQGRFNVTPYCYLGPEPIFLPTSACHFKRHDPISLPCPNSSTHSRRDYRKSTKIPAYHPWSYPSARPTMKYWREFPKTPKPRCSQPTALLIYGAVSLGHSTQLGIYWLLTISKTSASHHAHR